MGEHRRHRFEMEIINWDNDDLFNSSPIIKAKIDMTTCYLLIDTGASISFIDKKFLDKQPLLKNFVEKGDRVYLSNMIGGVSKSTKIVRTKNLTFGGKKYEHDFNIVDLNISQENKELVYHGILGFDFLVKHKVVLNFSDFNFAI